MQKQHSGGEMNLLVGNHAQAKVQKGKDAAVMAQDIMFQAVTRSGIVIKPAEDLLTQLAIVDATKALLDQDAKFSLSEVIVDLLDTGTRVQPKGFIITCTMLASLFTLNILKAKLKCTPFFA